MNGEIGIDAKPQRLHNLLIDAGVYEVPEYQRNYAWEAEQISRLWSDLASAIEGTEAVVFLGAMVFVRTDEDLVFEVLDGQQRFASVMLALRALRSVLEDAVAPETISELISMITPIDAIGKFDFQRFVRLQMNEQDRPFFNTLIETGSSTSPTRTSHKLLTEAFETLKDKFQGQLEKPGLDPTKYWTEVRKALATRVYVIRIEVSNAVDAQRVFEALNSAGLDLTVADLVKNHILREVKGTVDFDPTYAHWVGTVNSVGDQVLPRYLRTHWNSSYGFARESDLYKAVSDRIVRSRTRDDQVQVTDFAKSLEREGSIWTDLRSPDGVDWITEHPGLRRNLSDLRDMGAVLPYVPLLALRARHGDEVGNFERCVRWFRDFYVRYTVVGGKAANEIEEEFSKWAVRIRSDDLSLDDLHSKLTNLAPVDFIGDFKRLRVRRLLTARVLLARINDSVNDDNKLTETITSGKRVHVEHIIPRKPAKWEDLLKTENLKHEEVVHSIGNLTLLLGPRNIEASNDTFEKKKPKYVASEAPINAYLTEIEEFGAKELAHRTAWLAEQAANVWTLE